MKKHGTDLVSLIFGLIFAAFVVWWAVAYGTDFEADARWLIVGGLAALAAVILATTLTRRPKPVPPPAEDPAAVSEEAPSADESPTEIIERDDWPRYDEPAEDDKADGDAHDDTTRDEPAKGPRS
jgi:hypothetical protein